MKAITLSPLNRAPPSKIKVRGYDGIELRDIVGKGGSEYRAYRIYDLLLLGSSIHISSKQRHNG
jgi:hypothetical protein